MTEEARSSQEHTFAQKAREVAEGITGAEAVLEEDRAQLSRDMLEVKDALMEANRHLPGIALVTEMPSGINPPRPHLHEEYRRDHQLVLLSEPVTGEDESLTYVAVTPAGFKGLSFRGKSDEKHTALKRVLGHNLAGAVYSDRLNGYYKLSKRDPISGRAQGEPTPEIIFGGFEPRFGTFGSGGIDEVVFKGDELTDVPEETVMEAYASSQEAAAGKLKKVGNVDEQKQAIQGQRAIGQRLLESMGQQPSPPAAGQS